MNKEENSAAEKSDNVFVDKMFWKEAYQCIEEARNAISRRSKLSDAEKIKILKERASRLAQISEIETERKETIRVTEFIIGSERYGIEPHFIREVYPLMGLTEIPCTPEFVCGVINLRGQLISVIDIKKFFGMKEKELTGMNKVVVLHSENMEFGILADEIIGVKEIYKENIQSSLPTLTEIREDYLKGVTDQRLVILDGEKLLYDKKIIVNEEVKIKEM